MMETYIKQLISDLEAARHYATPPLMSKGRDEIPKTSIERFSRIEKIYFPPVEKLSHEQILDLVNAIIALLEANRYVINLPERLPIECKYQKLLDKWTEEIWHFENGLNGLSFCPEETDNCDMYDWCDWTWECNPDPNVELPVYNGIYDDNGNKINILDIPIPKLCLSCESFLDNDWDENLLCNLTRADKREEGEEFVCYAWREKGSLAR